MPAYDEAENLPAVLLALRRMALPLTCVVIDDGSRDDTARLVREAGVEIVRHPFNLGYGAALQTGYKYALRRGADLVVQMDADGQHDPREISKLVAPVRSGECDLVVGSRFLAEAASYRMGPVRSLGRGVFRALARLLGLRVTDPTSGFQAMNRRVLELYTTDAFPSDFPDVDVLLAARRHGLVIRECPVQMAPGARASRIHGGARSLYYVYKMLLSLWVVSTRR